MTAVSCTNFLGTQVSPTDWLLLLDRVAVLFGVSYCLIWNQYLAFDRWRTKKLVYWRVNRYLLLNRDPYFLWRASVAGAK